MGRQEKRIACFIANCWDLEDKDKSWKEIESLDVAGLDLWLKRWDGELNIKGEKYVHMIKYEVYGRFLDTAEAMHSGMREFFPNVDYEFVCFVCDSGYAEEYVTIVVNGKRFDKEIIFHEIGDLLRVAVFLVLIIVRRNIVF